MTASIASRSIRAVSRCDSASWRRCAAAAAPAGRPGRPAPRRARPAAGRTAAAPAPARPGASGAAPCSSSARCRARPELSSASSCRPAPALQLLGPVVPVVDLLRQPVLHRRQRLVDQLLLPARTSSRCCGTSWRWRGRAPAPPGPRAASGSSRSGATSGSLLVVERAVVEVGRVAGGADAARRASISTNWSWREITRRLPSRSVRPSWMACSR